MNVASDSRVASLDRLLPLTRGLERSAPEVRLLVRFLIPLVFVTGALTALLWTRMQVRGTALALDEVRSAAAAEETLRGRLLVERTMLRSPSRLGAVAASEGLVAPVAVIDVVPRAPPVSP